MKHSIIFAWCIITALAVQAGGEDYCPWDGGYASFAQPPVLQMERGGVDYFYQRNHNRSVVVLADLPACRWKDMNTMTSARRRCWMATVSR